MKIDYNVYLSYIIYILVVFYVSNISNVRHPLQIQIDTASGLNQIFLSYRKFKDDFSIIHLFLVKICIQKIASRN